MSGGNAAANSKADPGEIRERRTNPDRIKFAHDGLPMLSGDCLALCSSRSTCGDSTGQVGHDLPGHQLQVFQVGQVQHLEVHAGHPNLGERSDLFQHLVGRPGEPVLA